LGCALKPAALLIEIAHGQRELIALKKSHGKYSLIDSRIHFGQSD
jgi:hypothetical protein